MKNSFKKSAAAAAALLILVAPALALAVVVEPPPAAGGSTLGSKEGVITFLNSMLTWLSRIFWIVAIFFIIFAGFTYLTAAGDPEKVTKANHMLRYAVIGIAVALLATVLPTLIQSFLA